MRRQKRFQPGAEVLDRRDNPSGVLGGVPDLPSEPTGVLVIDVDPSAVGYLGWAAQRVADPDPMLMFD